MGEDLGYMEDKISFRWYSRKVIIVWMYLFDFIKNGELRLAWILIKSTIVNKSNTTDLVVNTHFGKFLIRKNTLDFKMANMTYEHHVIKFFKRELAGTDIVIDVGSNSGLYSMISGKENVKTLAFEPIKDSFNVLLKNIELNNLTPIVKAFNYGLGNKEENIKFNYNPYNTGAASKYRIHLQSIKEDGEIKVFDKLKIPELSNIKRALIKIDVEGMEADVIEGMQELIKSIPVVSLIIEIKHTGIALIQDTLLKIADFEFKQIDSFNMSAKKIN